MVGDLPERLNALSEFSSEHGLCLRVRGDCMAPWLQSGAAIWVKGAAAYWPGDCLAFAGEDGRLTIHRLIGCYRRHGEFRYLTQADRADQPDRHISKARIIGKLVGGDCDPRLAKVPFRHRAWALARFFRFASRRLLSR